MKAGKAWNNAHISAPNRRIMPPPGFPDKPPFPEYFTFTKKVSIERSPHSNPGLRISSYCHRSAFLNSSLSSIARTALESPRSLTGLDYRGISIDLMKAKIYK